jgi:hypothetical protein
MERRRWGEITGRLFVDGGLPSSRKTCRGNEKENKSNGIAEEETSIDQSAGSAFHEI